MLSIVIPTYNEEDYLPHLLASLRAQTYHDMEIIVADAHSTDRTRAIATAAGCRVVDGGLPGVGRNAGAQVAKGDLLLFLDADVVPPGNLFLTMFVAAFTKQELDIATVWVKHMSDRKIDEWLTDIYNHYVTVVQRILPHSVGFCIMVKKNVHERIGGFDETILLAEDHDYGQRAVKQGARYGVLKDIQVPVSVRRFDRDGYLSITCKYVLCELHMMTLGPVRTDIFRYRFGHRKKRKVAQA